LKFRKALGNHAAAERVNDLAAPKDRQWQRRGGALNDGVIGAKFNLTRWDFRIHGLSVAFKQFTRHSAGLTRFM